MKVSPLPSGVKLIASSDFDEKLVARLIPSLAAIWVTFTVLSTAPLVVLTSCRKIAAVMPKFASTVSLFQTLEEQLLSAQKALPAVAFSVEPPVRFPDALNGSAVPAANPVSVYVLELTIRSPPKLPSACCAPAGETTTAPPTNAADSAA